MGSRKQGGRSKDPRGGLGEKPVNSQPAQRVFSFRVGVGAEGGGGRMKGPNHPSPRSGDVAAKRSKDGLPERKGPPGHPLFPAPYSVMRLASSVQAAVELAEKTR